MYETRKSLCKGLHHVSTEFAGAVGYSQPVALREAPGRHYRGYQRSAHPLWVVPVATRDYSRHHVYDSAAVSDALLAAATRLDPDDAKAIVEFTATWGFVTGETLSRAMDARPLDHLQAALREIQYLARWLIAMKRRRWKSPDLPSRTKLWERRYDVRERIEAATGLPVCDVSEPDELADKIPPKFWSLMYWADFAAEMNERIGQMHLSLGIDLETGTLSQGLSVGDPRTVMILRLWQHAEDQDSVARQCKGCQGVFFRAHTNTKKIYCSYRCKVRVNVRRHRAKEKRRRRPA